LVIKPVIGGEKLTRRHPHEHSLPQYGAQGRAGARSARWRLARGVPLPV